MADYRGTRNRLGAQLAQLANGDREVVGLSLGRGYTQELRRDGSEATYHNGVLVDQTPTPTRRIVIPLRSG